jgi:hypothetical protein
MNKIFMRCASALNRGKKWKKLTMRIKNNGDEEGTVKRNTKTNR